MVKRKWAWDSDESSADEGKQQDKQQSKLKKKPKHPKKKRKIDKSLITSKSKKAEVSVGDVIEGRFISASSLDGIEGVLFEAKEGGQVFCPNYCLLTSGYNPMTTPSGVIQNLKHFRVLRFQNHMPIVTAQPLLVRWKGKVLEAPHQAFAGLVSPGYVEEITENGQLIVRCFNNMRGVVALGSLGKKAAPFCFYKGRNLAISILKLSPLNEETLLVRVAARSNPAGTILSVSDPKIIDDGLFVTLPNNSHGFIPNQHLADFQEHISAAKQYYAASSSFNAVLLETTHMDGIYVLSVKPSFLNYASEENKDENLIPAAVETVEWGAATVRTVLGRVLSINASETPAGGVLLYEQGQTVNVNVLNGNKPSLKALKCDSNIDSLIKTFFLERKYYSLRDSGFKFGEVHTLKVKHIEDNGRIILDLKKKAWSGVIEQNQVRSKKVKKGVKLNVRVVGFMPETKTVQFSALKRILHGLEKPSAKSKPATGTQLRGIVEFVSGSVVGISLPDHGYSIGYSLSRSYNWDHDLYVGQETPVYYIGDAEHSKEMLLRIEAPYRRVSDFTVGDSISTIIKQVTPLYITVTGGPFIRGKVPLLNVSSNVKVLEEVSKHYSVGQLVECRVTNANLSLEQLTLTMLRKRPSFKKGSILCGFVRKSFRNLLRIDFPDSKSGAAFITDLCDNFVENPFEQFPPGKIIQCKVIRGPKKNVKEDIDEQDKFEMEHEQNLSIARPDEVVVSLRQSDINSKFEASNLEFPTIRKIDDVSAGSRVQGYVYRISKSETIVWLGLDITGVINNPPSAFHNNYQEGSLIITRVLTVDAEQGYIKLAVPKMKQSASEALKWESIRNRTDNQLSDSSSNESDSDDEEVNSEDEMQDESNENDDDESEEETEDKLQTKNKIDQHEESDDDEYKSEESEDSEESDSEESSNENSEESDVDDQRDIDLNDVPVTSEQAQVDVSAGFQWSGFQFGDGIGKTKPMTTTQNIQESDNDEEDHQQQVEDEESDQEDNAISGNSDSKVISNRMRTEKKRQRQWEEKTIREREEELQQDILPETPEDFQKLLFASPNSSFLWVRYMTFMLSLMEIDKARDIAEKGLKTIEFGEQKERLNLWKAYINLEAAYGSDVSLNKVFQRAIQYSDPESLYLHLASVYQDAENPTAAEETYKRASRKFRHSRELWIEFITFHMRQGSFRDAHKILQRAIQSLDKVHVVPLMVRYASLLYRFERETEGRKMLEDVVQHHPKRTDVWSAYIDLEVQQGEYEHARDLYERVTTLKLSSKKMKNMLKKFLAFEKQHGTPKHVELVKQKAIDYVKSKAY